MKFLFFLLSQTAKVTSQPFPRTTEPDSPGHSPAAFFQAENQSLIFVKSFVKVCIVCQIDRASNCLGKELHGLHVREFHCVALTAPELTI